MNNIGRFYDQGRGVPQDYAKAREWYDKAAAAGDAVAMANIGGLYAKGHGVPQDYAKARKWWEKAAWASPGPFLPAGNLPLPGILTMPAP